jgi:methyltransferase (TIGR00027 family)
MEAKASSTAIAAARMRAAHLLLDGDPKVFRDDFALRFSGSDEASLREYLNTMLAQVAAKVGSNRAQELFGSIRTVMVMRSRYTEDALSRAIAHGITRFAILGAGLDSFAWRRPDLAASIEVFEIDHVATQQWKQQRLRELGMILPSNLTFVPIDFEKGTLIDGLRQGGFPLEKPAFFSWLGVTQYLTSDTVLGTLKQVATLAPTTEISFTFVVPQTSVVGEDHQVFAMSVANAAALGEPWLSFFEPAELQSRLREMGFTRVEHLSPNEANARYFAGRSDGLRVPAIHHVMLARV